MTLCVANDMARQPIYHKQESGSVSSPQVDDENDENFEHIGLWSQLRSSSVGKLTLCDGWVTFVPIGGCRILQVKIELFTLLVTAF